MSRRTSQLRFVSLSLAIMGHLFGACVGDDKKGAEPSPGPLTQAPFSVPEDPLASADVNSCAVIDANRCESGTQQQCALYEPRSNAFVVDAAEEELRAYHFDRWYDLYHQPDGQTVNRRFTQTFAADTPESTWGDDDNFRQFYGKGDSAIWSGTALTAYIMRYLATGTRADYERMRQKVADVLLFFDVTGIEGYLARTHYVRLPPEAPRSSEHLFEYGEINDDGSIPGFDYKRHYIEADDPILDVLPDVYRDGFVDEDGTNWGGVPVWHGNPSRDQYSGMLTSLPLAFELLDDDGLKARILRHLRCYLHRLQRIEIRDIDRNQHAQDALDGLLGTVELNLDEGDVDLTSLDTIVIYALPQPNTKNVDTFDDTCPASFSVEADEVWTMASDDYLSTLLSLAARLNGGEQEHSSGFDHAYFVNVRGSDANLMMALSAFVHRMSGEDRYAEFLRDELVDKLHADDVAQTSGALVMPKWCREFFAEHVEFPPVWAFRLFLADERLAARLDSSIVDELWTKVISGNDNLLFQVMMRTLGFSDDDELSDAHIQRGLATFGGNGGVLQSPRRSYRLDRQSLIDEMPAGTAFSCPSEDIIATCTAEREILGVSIPAPNVDKSCGTNPGECVVDDKCYWGMADVAMPLNYRVFEDFVWQRNPFKIGVDYEENVDGAKQSPGVDVIEPYWMARAFGLVDQENRHVLAWQNVGSCDDE